MTENVVRLRFKRFLVFRSNRGAAQKKHDGCAYGQFVSSPNCTGKIWNTKHSISVVLEMGNLRLKESEIMKILGDKFNQIRSNFDI